MNTFKTRDCKDCGKRTRVTWTLAVDCGSFVRSHYHLDGVCGKWAGLRPSDPICCPRCGSSRVEEGVIHGRVSQVPCRARCVDAIGDDCECECGGENHGRS